MRKLVDAPRKKKQWTEKEEAYLQDKWGTVSIKGLSKALGRSENAIIVRAQRLGCGAHLESDVRISLNQFMLALYGGAQMGGYTSNRLIQNGLPVKWHRVKKNRFRVIDIEDFWKWAEKNKSLLDFSRFDKYTLGAERTGWMKSARRTLKSCASWPTQRSLDKSRGRQAPVPAGEESVYIQRAGAGAQTFRRSHQAPDPGPWNRDSASSVPPRKWTEEEVETLCSMVDAGYDFTLIAEKLNRNSTGHTR